MKAIWLGAAGVLVASGASAAPLTAAQQSWRDAVTALATPEGCFAAAFPKAEWHRVACAAAPAVPFLPRTGARTGRTVGNGHDYAEVTASLVQAATGSFPTVTGVTRETGANGANDYSLQLNSGFMKTSGCKGGASGCQTWQQFIYASGFNAVFMQYWLINYRNPCPSGWNSFGSDCYKNSASVNAPLVPATSLGNLSVIGTASRQTDTVTFTDGSTAYRSSGRDSVVGLAQGWKKSEFNVVGDGGGSSADFNTGSSITVKIAATDGSTAAPRCAANSGTTGETNNLNLGACTKAGGATPAISFVELN